MNSYLEQFLYSTHLKHASPQFDEPKLLISHTKMAKIMARITVTAKLLDFTYAILFRAISHSISLSVMFDNFFEVWSLESWKLENLEAWKFGSLKGWKAWKLETLEAWKLGTLKAWKLGSFEAWKLGILEA